jgi:hypothetical protein
MLSALIGGNTYTKRHVLVVLVSYFVRVLEVRLGLRVLMKRMSVLKERWERVFELGVARLRRCHKAIVNQGG